MNYSFSIKTSNLNQCGNCLTVEACASAPNPGGSGTQTACTTWDGSLDTGKHFTYTFSPSQINLTTGDEPKDQGWFQKKEVATLNIDTCGGPAAVELLTENTHLKNDNLNVEILTKWRVHGDFVTDSGYVNVESFSSDSNEGKESSDNKYDGKTYIIPEGRSGSIYFSLRWYRDGLGDRAGDYSADIDVEVSEN